MFSFPTGFCNGFHRHSSLTLPHLSAAGFSAPITESCDEDVEKVGVDDVEELVDTRDNEWFGVRNITLDILAIFGEMCFLSAGPVVSLPMILV